MDKDDDYNPTAQQLVDDAVAYAMKQIEPFIRKAVTESLIVMQRRQLKLVTPIEELQLPKGDPRSVRIRNCLWNEGIKFVEELDKIPDAALMRIPNLGRKSIDLLRECAEKSRAIKSTSDHAA